MATRTGQQQETRRAILAAAAERFAEDGFDRATVQQIAHAAGVTPPTVYAYFAGKDALLDALLDGTLTEIATSFELSFPRGLNLEQKLELLVAHQLRWAEGRRHVYLFLLRHKPVVKLDPKVVRNVHVDSFEGWLTTHSRPGELHDIPFCAQLLASILNAAFHQWMDTGGVAGHLVLRAPRLIDVFFHGVCGRTDG